MSTKNPQTPQENVPIRNVKKDKNQTKAKISPLKAALKDLGVDESTEKELKFSAFAFLAIVAILAHYAWFIGRYLYGNLTTTWLTAYALLLVANIVLMGYLLVKVVYPRVYGSKVKEE